MVGVKLGNDKMLQCWVGYQTEADNPKKPTQTKLAAPSIFAQTSSETEEVADAPLLAQTEAYTEIHARLGSYTELPVEERIKLAQTINEANLTWTASAYLDDESDGLELAQTGSSASAGRPIADGT